MTKAQLAVLRRMNTGDYGVPHITPDAAGWEWKSDGTKINSMVIRHLWTARLVDQTYTDDARLLITERGKREATSGIPG